MAGKGALLDFLTERIDEVLRSKEGKDVKLKAVCRLLKENVSHGICIVTRKWRFELAETQI